MKRALLLALMLGGCSMAPAYQRPASPVPASLPQGSVYPALADGDGAIDAIGWRSFMADARLQRVIEAALANNRDLRASVANVAAARARWRVARAATLPTIASTAAASRYHGSVSQAGYVGGNGDIAGTTSEAYGVSGGVASFEIDLWGRVKNQSRAALETWLASDEGRKAAQIALVAQVADAWLTVAADADALTIARETSDSREAGLKLAQDRLTQGIGTELELAEADSLAQSARAQLASTETALAEATNTLTLLVGAPVAAADLPTTLGDGDAVLPSLPVGLSSAVLLRRPDVLSAEHALRAANANIGAARAALFPTISLTGLVGLASGSLGGLFDGNGNYSSGLAGSATQTLFDGGAKAGNVAAARASFYAALATYEKAVQAAFADTANALARRGTIDRELQAQTAYAASAGKVATITQARYRAGIDTGMAALEAQRTAYAARQALVAARLERATNMVTLYEVLGGGLKP